MRLAVISDVHGNLEALVRVLADIDTADIDEVICLGDNIGYGPDPSGVVRRLADRGIVSLLGNHELAAGDPIYLEWFNPVARKSLLRTMELMDSDTLDRVTGFDRFRVDHGCRFVHGFPPDSPVTYLFQVEPEELREAFEQNDERICFVGHTHDLILVEYGAGEVRTEPLAKGMTQLRDLSLIHI